MLTLEELKSQLEVQATMKRDIVVPSTMIRMKNNQIWLPEDEFSSLTKEINALGIHTSEPQDLIITPNHLFHGQLSEKLNIPLKYYERMQQQHPALLDMNVSSWMNKISKNYLVRTFDQGGDTMQGRAFLSDKFFCLEHYDIVFAVLHIIAKNKLNLQVMDCDITDSKVYVRLNAPDIAIAAPALLKNWKNPLTGEVGNDKINAGIIIKNSETGQGAFEISPRIEIQVCHNGMTRRVDGFRRTHLGAKLDKGEINWSKETQRNNIELMKSQIKDSITYFTSQDYLENMVRNMEGHAGYELKHPADAVINTASELRLGKDETDEVMKYFMKSGDPTSWGVVQAVTLHAHQQNDADKRDELETAAFEILPKIKGFDRKISKN